MDYISVKTTSEKWGISERRIQKLCKENRIPGVIRFSRMWLIPKNATKPVDRRVKTKTSLDFSIENIIEQYGKYIYNLSLKLVGKPEKAEDIAQETFIKAWRNIERLKDPAALNKWLRTICVNEYKMMVRKESREDIEYRDNIEELESDGDLLINVPATVIDEIQMTDEIISVRNGCFNAMARKLSFNQRIAFSLIDMFGLSFDEVSEILSVTPKAVKGLLYRARMNLDAFFQDHCSVLDIKNPCQCTAWVDFCQFRESLQMEMKFQVMDYKNKEYSFNQETRKQIAYYYQQIPEQQPPQRWYKKVIEFFSSK